jgi:hypothetical protein
MSELVEDEVNGYLHAHRGAASLAQAIRMALADPPAFAKLGARGYLASTDGRVPSADAQAEALQKVYSEIASPCCVHRGEEPATPRSSNDGNASPASEPERAAWS